MSEESVDRIKTWADKIGMVVLLVGIPAGSLVGLLLLGRWLFG